MHKYIDLRGTPCPINFVRCRLEIDRLDDNENLQVDLDRGEPERMVLSSLKEQGYKIKVLLKELNWISLPQMIMYQVIKLIHKISFENERFYFDPAALSCRSLQLSRVHQCLCLHTSKYRAQLNMANSGRELDDIARQ